MDAHGIEGGQWLPLSIPELKILGAATVTAVEPCPEIACGEGSVVTGRFVTRQVDEIARVEILAPDGTTQSLEGTPVHPILSVDRREWLPLGEINEGEPC